ncbi:replicase, partial [Enterobacter kobei]
ENEVSGIAKSIAKWTINHFSKDTFESYIERTHSSEIQSIRGKKSKGGGRKKEPASISSEKPWISMGISRSTYYRNKSRSNSA